MGTDAGRAFQRHYTRAVDFDFIARVIGNNVGPAGREALARIAALGRDLIRVYLILLGVGSRLFQDLARDPLVDA
jgi:hypothetical protein